MVCPRLCEVMAVCRLAASISWAFHAEVAPVAAPLGQVALVAARIPRWRLARSAGRPWAQAGEALRTQTAAGKGAYERVTSLKYVGEGRGSVNKETVTLVSGRQPMAGAIFCMLMIPILLGTFTENPY